MNYYINNLFNKNECKSIIEFAENNGIQFSYNPNEVWDCKRIHDDEFKNSIINRLYECSLNNKFKLWFNFSDFIIKDINISLTKYYDNRWLDLHLDKTSQLTTVIVLSDGFEDGRFVLSDKNTKIDMGEKFDLKIGESISFDGSKVYHGVMNVTIGIRYALNIWMTNTDFKYSTALKNTKSII